MYAKKKISASALLALKEALSAVYWYKGDLRKFLSVCLADSPILATLNWDETKRDIAWTLVDRLSKNEDSNQPVLLHIMLQVSSMTDFSHLKRLDGGEQKEEKAIAAVQALLNQTKGLEDLLRDGNNSRENGPFDSWKAGKVVS